MRVDFCRSPPRRWSKQPYTLAPRDRRIMAKGCSMQQAETPIYSSNGNVISRSKAIIAGTTFAMRNVTSVRASGDDRQQKLGWILIAVGIIIAIAAFKDAWGIALAVALLGVAFLMLCKPTYTVVIMTTNGKEFGALRTHDSSEAKRIVDAFNQAIEQV